MNKRNLAFAAAAVMAVSGAARANSVEMVVSENAADRCVSALARVVAAEQHSPVGVMIEGKTFSDIKRACTELMGAPPAVWGDFEGMSVVTVKRPVPQTPAPR